MDEEGRQPSSPSQPPSNPPNASPDNLQPETPKSPDTNNVIAFRLPSRGDKCSDSYPPPADPSDLESQVQVVDDRSLSSLSFTNNCVEERTNNQVQNSCESPYLIGSEGVPGGGSIQDQANMKLTRTNVETMHEIRNVVN